MNREKDIFKELKFAQNKINSWYVREGNKMMNIISRPYNSPVLFGESIFEVLKKNKSVIYITNGYCENQELVDYINGTFGEIKHYYIKNFNESLEKGVLYFVNSSNLDVLKEKVELIIYDDITCFSNWSKLQVRERAERVYQHTDKMVFYSIETVFDNIVTIEVGGILNSNPIVEPRFITTRIDLKEDIPDILSDYFTWFKENKRKVIVHAPDKKWADRIYKLYKEDIPTFSGVKIMRFSEQDEIVKFEQQFSSDKEPVMIVTEYIGEIFKVLGNLDIIVIAAHYSRYDYKKIVFLCGKVGYREMNQGEMILVSREVTEAMEKAKEITRGLNKIVWEKQ
ncbi:MAG: hypothetical protein ABRQ25_00500 [Clostridiaceae bacterium]